MKKFLLFALFVSLFFLGACGTKAPKEELITDTATSTEVVETVSETESLSLANPASVNCVAMKGTPKIVTRADGNQYSICYFMDNRQCEEWALLRGDCPISGRKITGYDTEEQRYCAITGGEVDINKKTCTFKGQVCDLDKYYDGTCNE